MELFESMMLGHRKLNESKFFTVEFSPTGNHNVRSEMVSYEVETPEEAVQKFLEDYPMYNSTAIISINDEDGNWWAINEDEDNAIILLSNDDFVEDLDFIDNREGSIIRGDDDPGFDEYDVKVDESEEVLDEDLKGVRKKQLNNNIEELVGEYLNGIYDGNGEEFKNNDELVDYVYSQIFDMKSDGTGYTRYGRGICDDLKYLGKDYIVKEIIRIGNEEGVVATTEESVKVDEASLFKSVEVRPMFKVGDIIKPTFDDEEWGQSVDERWRVVEVGEFGRVNGFRYILEPANDVAQRVVDSDPDEYSDGVEIFGFESHPEEGGVFELAESVVNEDTVKKSNGKWVNRGDDGTEHGEFDTKKEADAQRRAMYANGFKGESVKKKVGEAYLGLSLGKLAPFDQNAWDGYAGAEGLGKDEPLIYRGHEFDVIVGQSYNNEKQAEVVVEIFDESADEDGFVAYDSIEARSPAMSLQKAIRLANQLIDKYDNPEVSRNDFLEDLENLGFDLQTF